MDLDIDDLLSEENRIPVEVPGSHQALEYILGLGEDEELGEDVEVPFWLSLQLQKLNVVVPAMPKQFNHRMQGRLKAQAWSVNLREQNFYFYECALKVSRMAKSTGIGGGNVGSAEFRIVLRKALASRYAEIMRESLNSRGRDVSEFCDGLTYIEEAMFKAGHRAAEAHHGWATGNARRLRRSNVLKVSELVQKGNSSVGSVSSAGSAAPSGAPTPHTPR